MSISCMYITASYRIDVVDRGSVRDSGLPQFGSCFLVCLEAWTFEPSRCTILRQQLPLVVTAQVSSTGVERFSVSMPRLNLNVDEAQLLRTYQLSSLNPTYVTRHAHIWNVLDDLACRKWEEVDHELEDSVAGSMLSPTSTADRDREREGNPLGLPHSLECVSPSRKNSLLKFHYFLQYKWTEYGDKYASTSNSLIVLWS